MRRICAGALRGGAENYSPFAELADGEDFEGYCKRVLRLDASVPKATLNMYGRTPSHIQLQWKM
eukprot:6238108-Amphidinium_carterae.1